MGSDNDEQAPNDTGGEDMESTQPPRSRMLEALEAAFGHKLKEIPPEEYPPEGDAVTEVTFMSRSPRS